MDNKVKKQATEQQIKILNERQTCGYLHPYTCDRSAKECEVHMNPRDYSKDGVLIPTKDGWVCPCGKYKQPYRNEIWCRQIKTKLNNKTK